MALPSWKKILVVDLGFLGDTIHSIPAFRALAHTDSNVDVMTTPVGAEILSMVPGIHRVWRIPLGKPSPPAWQSLPTLLAIRKNRYDMAISFSGADRNLFCVAASGARETIVTVRRNRWWLRFLPITQVLPAPSQNQPLFRQRLEVLARLGWSGAAPDWDLQISPDVENKTAVLAPPHTVYISISAFGSPHKQWPLKNWAEMVRRVWEKRPEIQFLVGCAANLREQDRARQLAQLVGNPAILRVLDTSPSLVELASILRKAVCFAGLDSGVLHLAVALNRPTVSIFRDYAGKLEWAPEGKTHRVLSWPCSCHQDQINRCGAEPQCLAQVSAQEVAEAILGLLPSLESRR